MFTLFGSWADVEQALRDRPPGSVVRLPKGLLPHPRTYGLMPSFGIPQGQIGDWHKVGRDGWSIHVRDFGGFYEGQLTPPAVHLLQPATSLPPAAAVGGGVAVGAAIGAAAGKTAGATLAGAAIGGLFGVLFAAILENER